MKLDEIKQCFDFILPVVLDAGQVLLEAKNIKGEIKNGLDYDWVTVFDRKIEHLLHEKIKEKYPSHKFIGEESSTEEVTLTNDPTWIIDPIDGTENFIRRLKLSCISVALTVNKERVLGVVYNPYLDEMFTALKDHGAYLNGEKIKVSDQKDYKQSFFNYEISMARVGPYYYNLYMYRLKHLIPKVMSFRCLGSAALGLVYVACGRTDAYQCDGLYPWDAAAGSLIVQEAGGYIVDSSGKEFDLLKPNFLATSTKELADQYLEIEREADIENKNATTANNPFKP